MGSIKNQVRKTRRYRSDSGALDINQMVLAKRIIEKLIEESISKTSCFLCGKQKGPSGPTCKHALKMIRRTRGFIFLILIETGGDEISEGVKSTAIERANGSESMSKKRTAELSKQVSGKLRSQCSNLISSMRKALPSAIKYPRFIPLTSTEENKTIHASVCSHVCEQELQKQSKEQIKCIQNLQMSKIQMSAIRKFIQTSDPEVLLSLPTELEPVGT